MGYLINFKRSIALFLQGLSLIITFTYITKKKIESTKLLKSKNDEILF